MKQNIQLQYRGSLMSCNYRCDYCPFSKYPKSERRLEKDRQELLRFVSFLEAQSDFNGTIQIVPYGEALLYDFYWEGLARLSRCRGIEAVGAQSNFSFSVDEMLSSYREQGGIVEKLRLWGTFHPQMTTLSQFLNQCEQLQKKQILFSVGAVGNPQNLSIIRQLRSELPPQIYLWINRMDGLNRPYTPEEYQAFLSIDPYFSLECGHYPADIAQCQSSFFVDHNGDLFGCNLSKKRIGNLYEDPSLLSLPKKQSDCTRSECSCFLAYNQREEIKNMAAFGAYPSFRIPL